VRARAGYACGHGDGRKHNCSYVSWRESLVPIAEAVVDARYPEPVEATMEQRWKWERKWDAAFHREMERLVNDPFMKARFGGPGLCA
jgi:hypothetical protein